MDRVLMSLGFTKCYIFNIITLNLIPQDYMQHLQKVFDHFKEHKLKLHFCKCQFFQVQVEYMGHMIYLSGLEVEKKKVEIIRNFPNHQMLINYGPSSTFIIITKGLLKDLVTNVVKPLT
jgi:hypothetical protein